MTIIESNRVESDYWRAHERDVAMPEWDDLATVQQVEELRLGVESPFYDVFADDPHVHARCPECGPTVVDATGLCECGVDVTVPRPEIDNLRELS